MAKDRELIRLAAEKLSVDQIATRLDTNYLSVLKSAKRLGINLGLQPPLPDGRFKAREK